MSRWVRVGLVVVGMAGAAGAGVAVGGVTQEPRDRASAPLSQVLVVNKPPLVIPVEADVTEIRKPVVLDERTTVALREGTTVKLARPVWEYREVRVPTSPGNYASVVSALTAAGQDGWETTGLSFSSPGATVVVLKRQR